jgi:hypothetical protein
MPVLGLGLATRAALPWTATEEFGANLKTWLRPEDLPNRNKMYWTEDFSVEPPWKDGYEIISYGHLDPQGGNTAVRMLSNTPSANVTQKLIATIVGEDDVASWWWKRAPGHNGSSRTRMRISHIDGAGYTQWAGVVPAEWTRHEVTHLADAGTTSAQVMIIVDYDTGTQAIDIWHPQCEFGTSASAYKKNDAVPGGLVSLWPDRSGNGNDATQASQTLMPFVEADALDGYSVADHDDVDDNLQFDSQIDLTGAFAMFAVLRTHSAGDAHESMCFAAMGGNVYMDFRAGGGFRIVNPTENTTLAAAGSFGPATNYYLTVTRDASGNMKTYKNGVDVTAAGTPNNAGPFGMDGPWRRASAMVDGYELILVNREVTGDEISKVDAAMSIKYPTLGI